MVSTVLDRFRFSPGMPPWRLNALRLVSATDGVLLGALVHAAVSGREEAVHVLGPVHGGLFLVLMACVALAAGTGRWSWAFVGAVLLLGPLASIPGLEVYRRARPGAT